MVLGGGTIRKIFILLFIILIVFSNKPNNLLILVNKTNPIDKNYNPKLGSFRKWYVAKELVEPLKQLEQVLESNNITFTISEAYVSVKMQEKLFNTKVKEYEKLGLSEMDAKMETAKKILVPRYSEHHTGLAIDFKGNEKLYNYLEQNAYKYGFILRYPKDKEEFTKYKYDKTHYRYVGVEVATKMKQKNLCLEEYLKEEY